MSDFNRGLNCAASWHEKQADQWRVVKFYSLNDLEQSAYEAGCEAHARAHESYAASIRAMCVGVEPDAE